MISKELLSKIYGVENLESWFSFLENYEIFTREDLENVDINIYELSYLCREWAKTKDYQVSACRPIVQDDEGKAVINYWYKAYIHKFELGTYSGPEQVLNVDINCSSEPEAIFKACEWILEQLKGD